MYSFYLPNAAGWGGLESTSASPEHSLTQCALLYLQQCVEKFKQKHFKGLNKDSSDRYYIKLIYLLELGTAEEVSVVTMNRWKEVIIDVFSFRGTARECFLSQSNLSIQQSGARREIGIVQSSSLEGTLSQQVIVEMMDSLTLDHDFNTPLNNKRLRGPGHSETTNSMDNNYNNSYNLFNTNMNNTGNGNSSSTFNTPLGIKSALGLEFERTDSVHHPHPVCDVAAGVAGAQEQIPPGLQLQQHEQLQVVQQPEQLIHNPQLDEVQQPQHHAQAQLQQQVPQSVTDRFEAQFTVEEQNSVFEHLLKKNNTTRHVEVVPGNGRSGHWWRFPACLSPEQTWQNFKRSVPTDVLGQLATTVGGTLKIGAQYLARQLFAIAPAEVMSAVQQGGAIASYPMDAEIDTILQDLRWLTAHILSPLAPVPSSLVKVMVLPQLFLLLHAFYLQFLTKSHPYDHLRYLKI